MRSISKGQNFRGNDPRLGSAHVQLADYKTYLETMRYRSMFQRNI